MSPITSKSLSNVIEKAVAPAGIPFSFKYMNFDNGVTTISGNRPMNHDM